MKCKMSVYYSDYHSAHQYVCACFKSKSVSVYCDGSDDEIKNCPIWNTKEKFV